MGWGGRVCVCYVRPFSLYAESLSPNPLRRREREGERAKCETEIGVCVCVCVRVVPTLLSL